MDFLETLDGLLGHIKSVETEIIELSKASQMRVTAFIERNGLVLDDETLEALQYQDIISQQLSATTEAIGSAQSAIEGEMKTEQGLAVERLGQMQERLHMALEQAKERYSAFAGKTAAGSDEDEIEFF